MIRLGTVTGGNYGVCPKLGGDDQMARQLDGEKRMG